MSHLRKCAPMAQVSSKINQLVQSKGLLFKTSFDGKDLDRRIDRHFPTYRNRVFGPQSTLFAFLSQVLSPDKSCAETVARFNAERVAQGLEHVSPDNSAYCKARDRMPEDFLRELATDTAFSVEKKVPVEWLWKGRAVKVVDGSTLTMSDTPENQAEYPQTASQIQGLGFPITRMMAVFSLATGCILDFANGSYTGKGTGEHGLLRQLMHCFQPGDVVIGDAYFPSYFLMATLQAMGVDTLFAADGKRLVDFRKGKRLSSKDHIVNWDKPQKPTWMSHEHYDSMPSSIQLRECNVTIDRPGFRSKTVTLVTSMLNPEYCRKEELGWLYGQRWSAELNLGVIKTVLKMEHIRGKTPAMVRKEIWTTLLAYNLIRKWIGEAAYQSGVLPHELSFKGAVQNLNAFRPLLTNPKTKSTHKITRIILVLISKRRVANRPGRVEPRSVKKRPKAFPRLQRTRADYRENIINRKSS